MSDPTPIVNASRKHRIRALELLPKLLGGCPRNKQLGLSGHSCRTGDVRR